tara:strand:+ start:1608 stop:2504 length:897 start_codon:yes stop_codon:yes gene_type:complete
MAFPSDISLPSNARYYTFVETKKQFNGNYDITWSFQYKLPSTSITNNHNYQLGFSTFLTNLTGSPETWMPGLPGQYLGDRDPDLILSASSLFMEDEAAILITEDDKNIGRQSSYLGSGLLLKIAFDSTGLYAISGRADRPGVEWDQISRQSLVVRDPAGDIRANVPLSSLSTSFSTLSTDTYRTLRFRYANLGRQIHIDFRDSTTTAYTALTTIRLGTRQPTDQFNLSSVFCGFSLCTPVSTGFLPSPSDSLSAKDFFLRNFHVEGFEGAEVPTETVVTPSLSVNPNLTYTTVTNITA